MLERCDPQLVRQFLEESAILAKNPKNANSLTRSGVFAGMLSRTSRYGSFWLWLEAKDLEQAIALNPNDFITWHNYGDVNHRTGNGWDRTDHSAAIRAVNAFSKAIALNPKSARSYMGRGWSYLDMDDNAHANADFQKALQLDPSLRSDMQKEIGLMQNRRAQISAAKGTLNQMGRYYVERSANNFDECSKFRGYWTGGECHISTALNPGLR
jgi:tetratricopeptide (TPR) repeat protein